MDLRSSPAAVSFEPGQRNRIRLRPLTITLKRLQRAAGMIVKFPLRDSTILFTLAAVCLFTTSWTADAAPTKLDCILTQLGPDGKDVAHAITVAFDSGANSLVVTDGAKNFDLAHVKISTISINGYNSEISIGIERSSWAIVLQTYSQSPPIAEFGQCQAPGPPSH